MMVDEILEQPSPQFKRVRESGSVIDSAGAVVAVTVVADVVSVRQRAATGGRDGLQHSGPLVCGLNWG